MNQRTDVIDIMPVPEVGTSVETGLLWLPTWRWRPCNCCTDELRNARWPFGHLLA